MIEKKCDDDFEQEFNQQRLAELEYNSRKRAVIGEDLVFDVVEESPFKIQDKVKQYLEDLSFRFVQRYVYDPLCEVFEVVVTPPRFLIKCFSIHF